jgi:hypothetical protein
MRIATLKNQSKHTSPAVSVGNGNIFVSIMKLTMIVNLDFGKLVGNFFFFILPGRPDEGLFVR